MKLATKYFGGHSDLLCGVLVVKTKEEWKEVIKEICMHYQKANMLFRLLFFSSYFPQELT